MKTKFIFDLDGTLVKSDYEAEDKYFYDIFGTHEFSRNIGTYLESYEKTYERYEIPILCKHLTRESGFYVDDPIIEGWLKIISKLKNPLMEDAKEILEELKYNNKQIILLTNWFLECQIERLKNGGLYEYFDEFYGGDDIIKPNSRAFIQAIGNTPKEECIMIGDNYQFDILGAENVGIDALYFNKKDEIKHKNKIKELKEIRKWI